MQSTASSMTSRVPVEGQMRDGTETVFDRVIRSATSGLLGTLYVLNKNQSTPWIVNVLAVTINYFQMLAFPLSSAESFPWKDAAVWKPVLGFLDGASAALQCRSCGLLLLLTVTEGISVFRLFVEFASSQFQAIAFFAVLAYLAVLLSCAVTSGHSFSKRRFRVLWPLKFLRLSSRLNVALFIPVTATLISPFLCVGGATLGGSVQCSGPLYGLLLFVVAVVAALFATLTLMVTAVFYDSNPKSASAFSRAHARADVLKLCAELVLTVFFSLSTQPNPWAGTVLVFAGGVIWLGGILYYLPFFSLKTNATFAGMACSFLWACCCLLIAVGVSGEGKGGASSAAFLFLIGAPFAAVAGAALVLVRLHMVQSSSEQSVNPLAVEIRARMGLTPLAMKLLTAHDDPAAASTSRVNREFAAAVKTFKDSSLLEVAFARFLRHYRDSRSLELIHLHAAERKGPALDERFVVYQRRNMVEEEELSGGATNGKVTLITRVAAERHDMESRRASTRTKAAHVEFWKTLSSEKVDTSQLAQIGLQIANNTDVAQRHFTSLLRINRASPQALRSYARFLMECVNDTVRAESLLAEADQLENTAAIASSHKAHSEREVDFMLPANNAVLEDTKSLGVLHLGTDMEANAGNIAATNAAALRMVGMTEQDLVGRPIGSIMPHPISNAWTMLVRDFLLHGSPEFVDVCRFVLLSHSSGVLVPALAHVRPLGTRFAMLMESVKPTHAFLIYNIQDRRVLGCCRRATEQMGLEIEELGPGSRILVDSLVADFPQSLGPPQLPRGLVEAEMLESVDQVQDGEDGAAPERDVELLCCQDAEQRQLSAHARHYSFQYGQCDVAVIQWRLSPEDAAALSRWTPASDRHLRPAASDHLFRPPLSARSKVSVDVPEDMVPVKSKSQGAASPKEVAVTVSGADVDVEGEEDGESVASDSVEVDDDDEKAALSGLEEMHSDSGESEDEEPEGTASATLQGEAEPQSTAVGGGDGDSAGRSLMVHTSSSALYAVAEAGAGVGTPAGGETKGETPRRIAFDMSPRKPEASLDESARLRPPRLAATAGKRGKTAEEEEEEEDQLRESRTYGSRSSISSTLTTRLRRTMQSVGSKMEPSLLSLLHTLRNLLLLCSLLSILTVIVEAQLTNSYLKALHAIQAAAVSHEAVVAASVAAQNLVLARSGDTAAIASAVVANNASISTLKKASSVIELSLRELQELSREDSGLAQVMGGTQDIMWQLGPDGKPVAEFMSYFEGITRFLADIRLFSGSAVGKQAKGIINDPHAMFLLYNGPRGLTRLCEEVTAEMAQIAFDNRRVINMVDFGLFCLCVTVIDVLALGFVLPVIRRVFSSKEKILQSFFDVPMHVANDLYKQALAQLHSMLAEDGDADFDDLNELDNEIMAADAKRSGNEGGDSSQQDKGQGAQAAKGRRRRRRMEQSSSWKAGFLLILKFGIPIVGIVGFYLFYASLRFAEDGHLLGSEQMLGEAAKQNVQMELLIYHTRALAFPDIGDATLTPSANLTQELSTLQDNVRMVSERITFGDPLRAMPSIADLTDDLSTLYLQDTCNYVAQKARCSSYSDALLDAGLHQVLLRMVRRAKGIDFAQANSTATISKLDELYRAGDFILYATHEAQVIVETHVAKEIESGLTVHIISAIVLIVSCLVVYLFYYRPAVQAIDKELKRTRAMLLIVPEEMLRTLGSVRELLQEMAQQLSASLTA